MRNNIIFVSIILLLNGCSALPGMQNMDTSSMHVQASDNSIQVQPTLIPITPSYLLHESTQPYHYRIGPQDILSIVVWNHVELNSPVQQMSVNPTASGQTAGAPGYLVDNQGDVYLPLVGTIHVADKTTNEVRRLITRRFSYYIRKPQVFFRVSDYRSKKIYVLGEVLKPGFLPLNDQPISITDAISQAGTLDPNASDPHHIYVIRGDFAHPTVYWLNAASPTALLLGEKFYLHANDVVVVSTAVVTRWNRFLNQLLPSLQTVWYTKAITSR